MDWANLPTLVIEKIANHAANMEEKDSSRLEYSLDDANSWLLTVHILSTVCKNWKAAILGSKLIVNNKHNCIAFNEAYDTDQYTIDTAKRLVRCGYLSFAKGLRLSYFRCADTNDFDLMSKHAEGNTIEKIVACSCSNWGLRDCSAFLNFVSKSKPKSMELRCFKISVQSEAHQFWTLLMGLIQCCQHTIPFISFDLEAPMCNVETTYEDGITRITSVVDWGFITNYIYPGTVGAIGELQIDLWCYEGTSREMKFKDLNALTVSKFCHDAKEFLTDYTNIMRQKKPEDLRDESYYW